MVEMSTDDFVIEALPELFQFSGKLLHFLTPKETTREGWFEMRKFIQDASRSHYLNEQPQYTESKKVFYNFDQHKKAFQLQKEFCNPRPNDAAFFDVSKALIGLCGARKAKALSDKDWKPNPLFHTANLARLASDVISYPSQEGQEFLWDLDACMPSAFVDELLLADSMNSRNLRGEVVRLAISIRTQNAIFELEKHMKQNTFDPEEILLQVFYLKDNRTLRGWDFEGLRAENMSEAAQALVINRLNSFRRIIGDGQNPEAAIQLLKDLFYWDEFAWDITAWVRGVFAEIETFVTQMDGVENMMRRLRKFLGHELGEDLPGEALVVTLDEQAKILPPVARPEELRSGRYRYVT